MDYLVSPSLVLYIVMTDTSACSRCALISLLSRVKAKHPYLQMTGVLECAGTIHEI